MNRAEVSAAPPMLACVVAVDCDCPALMIAAPSQALIGGTMILLPLDAHRLILGAAVAPHRCSKSDGEDTLDVQSRLLQLSGKEKMVSIM
jgi:hypothetical protein